MSAVIQNEYTGNGSTTQYSFTFPYLKTSDIKASLDGVVTTAFTLPNATTLQFNTAPASGAKIKIFRETSVDDLTATFYAGSAIKSEDLNDNFTQNLFKTQEVGDRALSTLGDTMTGNLTMNPQASLVFEGATDDAHETTLTVADPTADRTITLPNVTGNVVTTGDTGTVATGMIAADAVTGAKIADDQINSEHYVDGSIDTAHIANAQVTTAKIADSNVTTGKLADDAVTAAKLANNAVVTANIVNANVTTAKIANDAVTNAKIADNSIDSEHYVDGSIDAVHLASNSVTNAKMADDSVGTAELQDSSVNTARLADNSVTLAKMADNSVGTSELVNSAVTTAKLGSQAVTNAKLANNAVTSAKIVGGNITAALLADDSVVTDKINDSAVTTAKIANDAITSDKIADDAIDSEHIGDGAINGAIMLGSNVVTSVKIATGAVTNAKLANNAVTTTKVADNAVTTAKIADSELKTLAGMQSGTASKLADSTALTSDIADLNQIDGLTKQTTISDSDASFPTSGAVVDYVAAQIAPLGGLEVIATEVAFPNTQPQAGVVISISDAGGVVFNGSGTSTTGRTVGGSTVTINNAPSSLNSETLVAGVGLMVSSTGSGQVYNYHKILGKEDDIKQLSDDINDFNARYRVGSTNPTSALDAGDLFFNTSTSKLLVYNATNTAWEEAQSIGNFFISTLSPAFNGSVQDFTITNAPSNAEQIILSINGVIQKPNAGTSTPSEGFALSGSTIKLAAAPATGSTYFAVVMGSTVNIGTPSNNTVSTAVLQNSSVTTAKIADDAVTSAKIAGDVAISTTGNIGCQALTTQGNITVNNSYPCINLTDTDNNSDYQIRNNNGQFAIQDLTNSAQRFSIASGGRVGIGTASPDTELEVVDASGLGISSKSASTQSTDSNKGLRVRNNSTTDTFSVSYKGQGYFAGRLGIGTTSPSEELTIRSSTPAVKLEDTDLTNSYVQLSAGDGDMFFSANDTAHNGQFFFRSGLNGTFTERARIDSVGRLGLGATIPTARLDVARLGSSWTGAAPAAGTVAHFHNGNNATTSPAYLGLGSGSSSVSGILFGDEADADVGQLRYSHGDNSLRIHTNASERVKIDSSGNVGIGTTSPNCKLHISGTEANLNSRIRITDTTNNHTLGLGADGSGTFQSTINDNRHIIYTNGTMRASWTANGLCFGTDTAAANALDDYEEGTWTPSPLNHSETMTIANAQYVRVGKLVHVQMYVSFGSTSNGNTVKIGGLPFNADGNTSNYSLLTSHTQGSVTNFHLRSQGSTSTLTAVHLSGGNGDAKPTYSNFSQKFIIMGGTYRAA